MIIVFAGPTIEKTDICNILDKVDVRPPASTGDILDAIRDEPDGIGLIDGYFEGVPSVWHKEILWALSNKIPVFGASSMGALRAAELHEFGMRGVGWIFEAFSNGILEDDDEVAVKHGPSEMGYIALCEPMVNIRVTLENAVNQEIIEDALAVKLIAMAKALYYAERNWENLFKLAEVEELQIDQLERLEKWLPEGRVDQKKTDAIAMLSAMKSDQWNLETGAKPTFDFQHTVMWSNLLKSRDENEPPLKALLLLDFLKIDTERYQQLRVEAASSLTIQNDALSGENIQGQKLNQAKKHFRTSNRLFTSVALKQWLEDHDLNEAEFDRMLIRNLEIDAVISDQPMAFNDALLQAVKAEEYYEDLMQEVEAASKTLEQSVNYKKSAEDLSVSLSQLTLWFFEQRLQISVPNDLDYFLQTHDFFSKIEFEQMMVRQYILWQYNHG